MNDKNEKYFDHKVNYYRQLLTLAFAIAVGCIAWFVSNFENAVKELLTLDGIVISITISTLFFINLKIRSYINKLRK